MSEMAKKAREAMKAKAKSLSSADPSKKVDSSTWTPPEPLNTEAKTGLRPISRRAFKKGGKVMGENSKCDMGRKPRQSGGSAKAYAIAKINRNVKEANEERPGVKHVGGMKKGGRTGKAEGGDAIGEFLKNNPAPNPAPPKPPASTAPSKPSPAPKPPSEDITDPKNWPSHINSPRRKDGGRAHKMGGGGMNFDIKPVIPGMKKGGKAARKGRDNGGKTVESLYPAGGNEGRYMVPFDAANQKMSEAARAAMYERQNSDYQRTARDTAFEAKKARGVDFQKAKDRADVARTQADYTEKELEPYKDYNRLKKGGRAKHTDEKMDIALIKKMVKPGARKGKNIGGMLGGLIPMAIGAMGNKDKDEKKSGGRAARKEGGGVFSGPGYPGKIPGVVPGGREARAMGGKTKRSKGKTNINIVIAAGKPADGADMMGAAGPMGGPTRPPGGMPVPVPPPQGAPPMPPAAMPMPMPMPQAPAGGPPTPRKSGGRLTAKASSYKDMTAGAGSGEGRLQKTDIAKARMGRKAGGKTYRSYKDMDAGSGSGLGRLEKTEIQAHKR